MLELVARSEKLSAKETRRPAKFSEPTNAIKAGRDPLAEDKEGGKVSEEEFSHWLRRRR